MSMLRHVLAVLVLLYAGAVAAAEPVNINTADAETLATAISGAGMERAQAIVSYRDQHGPFTSVDELLNVRGIGPKTLEKNRANLTAE
jgi:competence protein ComEA